MNDSTDPIKTEQHIAKQLSRKNKNTPEAQRDSVNYRYDILDPVFLQLMAEIANYGAIKYGDFNWKKSRLTGEKSPINHIYRHLYKYRTGQTYDHCEVGTEKYIHLAAIAFNAMMEFYYTFQEAISTT